MFKAYSVGIEQRDFELIRKIAKIVTEEKIVVKDLRYYDIKLEETKNDVLFIFGSKASRLANNINAKNVVHLPDLITLHPDTGITENRKQVVAKLKVLKQILEDDIKEELVQTISDPIPDISISDLEILEKNLKSKSITKWLTTTKNGKTVQISLEPETKEADINITFSELYALKIAMDALSIKEFTVIYNK